MICARTCVACYSHAYGVWLGKRLHHRDAVKCCIEVLYKLRSRYVKSLGIYLDTAFLTGHMELFKFPRTKHLFNAGPGGTGVSRDDLLMDKGEEALFYSETKSKSKGGCTRLVAIEEKVDGANLGISLDPQTLQFKVQNRSHFINSKTHRQFSTIDSWLAENSEGLYQVLGSEPGHYILFGEWLYAKHSIAYTCLPDYFLAFDLYDLKKGRFFSRRERNRRLEATGIHTVKLIAEQPLFGRNDVSNLNTL